MIQNILYYPTQLETKVPLLPNQIDGGIDEHLLSNLREKVEGKTDENGIIMRVIKLIDYDYGMIDKSNFMATTVYRVKYECLLCSPIKDLEIICVVDNIIKGFLIAHNGPVYIAVRFDNIDAQRFHINGNNITHLKSKKIIQKGDHLKVSVININSNQGEKNMIAMCKLLDMADRDDIKRYENEQALIMSESIGNQEFI
jgi:DNA-directed RNA polymerase subunit E'/Rpb7